jgi:hypothetical protein
LRLKTGKTRCFLVSAESKGVKETRFDHCGGAQGAQSYAHSIAQVALVSMINMNTVNTAESGA